ncbi:MAG TPA: Calx-beta domain-containing protein [Verrucomicrobiales bacterium]|nr:Calx-beta domain-containing protein [Verrucomicrobiales bacterium]
MRLSSASPSAFRSQARNVGLLTLLLISGLLADPGELDTDWGEDGFTRPLLKSGPEMISDAVIQSDGKILVAGFADLRLALARYDAGGTLDPSFGEGGVVITGREGSAGTDGYHIGAQLALQSTGRIVLGATVGGFTPEAAEIMRFHPDGSLDSAFGTEGRATIKFREDHLGNELLPRIKDLAVQSDDGIIIGANASSGGNQVPFGFLRLTAEGAVDMSFGDEGERVVDPGLVGGTLHALQVLPNDAIVAAGGSGYELYGLIGDERLAVVRLLPDGSRDETFGSNGVARAKVARRWATSLSMHVQPDGKIVVGGKADEDSVLVRFSADGSGLDPDFHGGQAVITDHGGNDEIRKVLLQSDGKIVTVGFRDLLSGREDFMLARYLPDGSPDSSFGEGGKAAVEFFGMRDQAHTAVLLPDGRVVAAGLTTTPSEGRDFALAGFDAQGALDAGFGENGRVVTQAARRQVGFSEVEALPDGRLIAGGTATNVFVVARYTAEGTLDAAFGEEGTVTIAFDDVLGMYSNTGGDIPPYHRFIDLAALRVGSDGRIAVFGSVNGPFQPTHYMMARLLPDGSFDPSFDEDGRWLSLANYGGWTHSAEGVNDGILGAHGEMLLSASVRYGDSPPINHYLQGYPSEGGSKSIMYYANGDFFSRFTIQPDGKVLVSAGRGNERRLLRLTANGRPDPSFGVAGFSSHAAGPSSVFEDGKIVVGSSTVGDGEAELQLTRLLPEGGLDPSFGDGGRFSIDLGDNESGTAVAALLDGTALVSGRTRPEGGRREFFIIRLLPDGSPDPAFGAEGVARFDNSVGGAGLAIQPNGGIVTAGLTLARIQGGAPPASYGPNLPIPSGNLALEVEATPEALAPGEVLTYDIKATNLADAASSKVVLTTNLLQYDVDFERIDPPVFSAISATSSAGDCVLTPAGWICTLGTLEAGASATVRLQMRVDLPSTLRHTFTVQDCERFDTDFEDNNVTVQTDVELTVGLAKADPGFLILEVVEGHEGTTQIVFPIKLSSRAVLPVSVDYATKDLHATAGEDYEPVSGTLIFAPGETLKTVAVTILGDREDEGRNESFWFNLSNAVNAEQEDYPAFGTILEDDGDALVVSKSAGASYEAGGEIVYTLRYSGGAIAREDVVLRDPLPEGTTFLSASHGGRLEDGVVVFSPGALDAGAEAGEVSFTVQASEDTTGPNQIVNSDYTVEAAGGVTASGSAIVSCRLSLSEPGGTPSSLRITRWAVTDENGIAALTWTSDPNDIFAIEASQDLETWNTVQSDIPSKGQATTENVALPQSAWGYFRVRRLP